MIDEAISTTTQKHMKNIPYTTHPILLFTDYSDYSMNNYKHITLTGYKQQYMIMIVC